MCRGSPRCRWIKVLTDLENGGRSIFYRHAGPTDLKRHPLKIVLVKKQMYLAKFTEVCYIEKTDFLIWRHT